MALAAAAVILLVLWLLVVVHAKVNLGHCCLGVVGILQQFTVNGPFTGVSSQNLVNQVSLVHFDTAHPFLLLLLLLLILLQYISFFVVLVPRDCMLLLFCGSTTSRSHCESRYGIRSRQQAQKIVEKRDHICQSDLSDKKGSRILHTNFLSLRVAQPCHHCIRSLALERDRERHTRCIAREAMCCLLGASLLFPSSAESTQTLPSHAQRQQTNKDFSLFARHKTRNGAFMNLLKTWMTMDSNMMG